MEHDGVNWQLVNGQIAWWNSQNQSWVWWVPGAGAQPPPQFLAPQPIYVQQRPAAMAHGAMYWTFVGWWWGPLKFVGRVILWLVFWPIGLWRSIRHHQDTQNDRMNRGYKQG